MMKSKYLILGLVIIGVIIISGYLSVPETSLEECDKLGLGEDSLKYSCYSGVGVEKLDTSICDKIPSNTATIWMIQCYAGIAIEKEDLSICDKLKERYCDNPDYCEKNEDYKNLCYEEIANQCSCLSSMEELYPSICALIKRKGIRGACD